MQYAFIPLDAPPSWNFGWRIGERLSTNEARIVEVQAKFTNLGYRLFTFFCFSLLSNSDVA
jgi:hypothetical protein